MPPKHTRLDASTPTPSPPPKRRRLASPSHADGLVPETAADRLSPLSDELLVRILACLSLPHLLAVAPVSRRFHRLAEDSQLWKALYYVRFVLPRAMRIPGFREKARATEHKLHYKGRRTLWADGRLGGVVREVAGAGYPGRRLRTVQQDGKRVEDTSVNWKRQFKIRHNWARGKCAVEELKLRPDREASQGAPHRDRDHEDEDNNDDEEDDDNDEDRSKMLVKVVEGLAVTADALYGLRAWDLKTRQVVAQTALHDAPHGDGPSPSCIAVDDRDLEKGVLDISVGFVDGSFGVWRLAEGKSLARRYRHEKSSNGELVGMSYSHPYLLTATGAVLVSLYTFDVPEKPQAGGDDTNESDAEDTPLPLWLDAGSRTKDESNKPAAQPPGGLALPAPFLMTSLKSHTSDPPLALSIRNTGDITVASIAYTFSTRQGWSIGIQDLHITPDASPTRPPHITTRLAYTLPVQTGPARTTHELSRSQTHPRARLTSTTRNNTAPSRSLSPPTPATNNPRAHSGPTTLSYTHPYLLATLPDNTLILHLCTSTAAALAISPGIRLWGHTSGISDADITARGKAVSVSSRGDEMRVWELEGRPSGVRSRSVEIRAGRTTAGAGAGAGTGAESWEDRRNWVGFDDEMVIVLKEAKGGRESLMVYDFT